MAGSPGYVFEMVGKRPGYPLSDPPVVLDHYAPPLSGQAR